MLLDKVNISLPLLTHQFLKLDGNVKTVKRVFHKHYECFPDLNHILRFALPYRG